MDELMGLLDRLEAARTTRDDVRRAARDAALAALRDAEDSDTVEAAWGRIAGKMDALFAHPTDVLSLRQAVLQLAVQGRLVPQEANDEPADILMTRIRRRRDALAKRRLREPSHSALMRTAAFALPTSWLWVRLDEICYLITDGTHYTPRYVEAGIPFISVKDMSNGILTFTNSRFISTEEHTELARRCKPERGDVLLTKVGTTGVAVEVDTDREFSIFVSVALLKGFPDLVLPRFLRHVLNSPFLRAQSADGTEGIGNKNLVLRKIVAFRVPLAPIGEQLRIVTKVDAIMAICDTMEARLTVARDLHAQFAAAAVHHLDV